MDEMSTLSLTAAGIAVVHTLMGPDHYLPFIAMARSGQWSTTKAICITTGCGIAHVASSIIIGFFGLALGLSLASLSDFEANRGTIAAWGLISFGLVYLVWGLRNAQRQRSHNHWHNHAGNEPHYHTHNHSDDHLHAHQTSTQHSFSTWGLFAIFLFGPCEPLIPLLMYPAATHSIWSVVQVTGVFAIVTIATMLIAVLLGLQGINKIGFNTANRYMHAITGMLILSCGILIQFAGL